MLGANVLFTMLACQCSQIVGVIGRSQTPEGRLETDGSSPVWLTQV